MRSAIMSTIAGVALAASSYAGTTSTTFENGAEGWVGPTGPGGATVIESEGGNPGANMRTEFNNFGISFRNEENPDFIVDLSAAGEVTISVDVKVNQIGSFLPVTRPWVLELRDFDNGNPDYPWDSVYFVFGGISESATGEWTTFTVTIEDPSATELPAGWGGYGAEDPDTFEPMLPEGRTFADILATYDEVVFTTLQPGFFFTFDDYDVQIDNPTIDVTPATTATTTTFEDGAEGWVGPAGPGGTTVIESEGGNPGANMRTEFNNFGISFFNNEDPGFVVDLSTAGEVTLAVDVKVNQIGSFLPVTRPWLVELRDFDNGDSDFPWDSVYFVFGGISESLTGDWTTFSVTIDDPTSTELPAGWGGYGAEDPDTFEPMLPEGRTFADILATYDEVVFTTLQPGFFFTFDDYDVQIDNPTLEIAGGGEVCVGDADGDEAVDLADLNIVLANFGQSTDAGDVTGDGEVDLADLNVVLGAFGTTCE